MPADQRGTVYRTASGYGIRYTDEHGAKRRKSGFTSKSAARSWFEDSERPRLQGRAVSPPDITLGAT